MPLRHNVESMLRLCYDVERQQRQMGRDPIPQIPEISADVFRSSVRPRLMETSFMKDNLLISGPTPTHRQHIALARKASKAWPSGGHQRA